MKSVFKMKQKAFFHTFKWLLLEKIFFGRLEPDFNRLQVLHRL